MAKAANRLQLRRGLALLACACTLVTAAAAGAAGEQGNGIAEQTLVGDATNVTPGRIVALGDGVDVGDASQFAPGVAVDAAEGVLTGDGTLVNPGAMVGVGEGVGVGDATAPHPGALVGLGEGVAVSDATATHAGALVMIGEGVLVSDATVETSSALVTFAEGVLVGDGTDAHAVNTNPKLFLRTLKGNEGAFAFADGSFDDPDPGQQWTAMVDYGDGSQPEQLELRADHTFTLTHQYDDSGKYAVRVAINDGAGGTDQASTSAEIENVAPTAVIANDGPVDEGGQALVSLTKATDVSPVDALAGFTYAFACDGEHYADATTKGAAACAFDDGPSLHTVRAKVIDKDGGATEYETAVDARNVAPTADLVADAAIEGAPAKLSFTDVHDPSQADTAAGFAYEIACDGSTFATASTCRFDDGPSSHLVRGRIKDKDGGVTTVEATVVVANAPPTGSLGNSGPVDEGAPVTVTASASDPSETDTAAGFAYRFACDGSTFAPAVATSSSICAFDDGPSAHVVRARVIDKDGGEVTLETTVEVLDVAPTATLAPTAPVDEGSAFSVELTAPHDPSSADTASGFAYAFDCGDGNGYSAFAETPAASCPTDDNGTRAVSAQIRDKDGGVTTYTGSAEIRSVAPRATPVVPATAVPEGSTFTVSLASPTDSSSRDAAAGFTYAFDCGAGYGPAASTASAICAAVDDPSAAVKARITDKDGASTEYPLTVPVSNVEPTLTLSTAPPVLQVGDTVGVAGTFTDPGARDTHTCALEWDDGSTSPGTVTESGGNGSCAASHTYTTPTVGTIAVTVTDKDGGTATQTLQVVVGDPDGGFVTGGGTLGNASFNLNAKYQKGVLKGTLVLGDFVATSFDWLAVAATRAELHGAGTLDGVPGYTFQALAADESPKALRVAIWDAAGAVVYDNAPGTPWDLARASPPAITSGSVQVHH